MNHSFTANVTNTVRWPEVLREHLNSQSAWRAMVGGKDTRVINLGRDGLGVVQFDDVYEVDGKKFEPDLVIVNFITDDILRAPYFRGSIKIGSREEAEKIARQLTADMISKINWRSGHLETFNITLGRLFGMEPKLVLKASDLNIGQSERYLGSFDIAVKESLTAIRQINQNAPNAVLLWHPEKAEMLGGSEPHVAGLASKFAATAAGLPIIDMLAQYPTYTQTDVAAGTMYFLISTTATMDCESTAKL